jgi:hypothetical protein
VFGKGAGAVLIWSPSVPRRLIGFFPARIESFRYGLPLSGWTHAYAPLGTPLVDRTAAEEVISAWLDLIAGHTRLPKLVLLPYLPADGPLADVLRRALARRAGGMAWFGKHARACLAPPGERASYLRHAMHGKKRKELRRQRKRLAEMGRLVCAPDTTPSNISVGLGDFLELEAAGWKGRAGTAAAQPGRNRKLRCPGRKRIGAGAQSADRATVHRRKRCCRTGASTQRPYVVLENRP